MAPLCSFSEYLPHAGVDASRFHRYIRRMTDDRKSSLALIAGSTGAIITMMFHPTAADLFAPGQFETVAKVVTAVHALGLLSMPVIFLGTLGLSQRLAIPNAGSPDRLPLAALVAYGFGLAAVMNAGIGNGFVVPEVGRGITGNASAVDVWRVLLRYTGEVTEVYALIFVVASSAAILLWSVSILRGRVLNHAIGYYGCVLGPATVALVLSGHLNLGVHGFGMIILGQTIWFVCVAALLWRANEK